MLVFTDLSISGGRYNGTSLPLAQGLQARLHEGDAEVVLTLRRPVLAAQLAALLLVERTAAADAVVDGACVSAALRA